MLEKSVVEKWWRRVLENIVVGKCPGIYVKFRGCTIGLMIGNRTGKMV